MHTTRTVWKRSEIGTRRAQIHDLLAGSARDVDRAHGDLLSVPTEDQYVWYFLVGNSVEDRLIASLLQYFLYPFSASFCCEQYLVKRSLCVLGEWRRKESKYKGLQKCVSGSEIIWVCPTFYTLGSSAS